jgi:peptide/nickel transport system substrate-binding protein
MAQKKRWKKISRREFLKFSAGAGLGLMATQCAVPQLTPVTAPSPEVTSVPAATEAVESVSPLLAAHDLSQIITHDPHRSFEGTYLLVDQVCYDTLVQYINNDYSKILPRLATDWQVSPDAKTFTFKLREEVRFHSGNLLTADVFKWSLERLKGIVGQPSYLMDPVESIEAPDDATLVINLSEPDATFVSRLTSPYFVPVDRDLIKEHGGTTDESDTADTFLTEVSAGTGPYMIGEYRRDEVLELVANPYYWEAPKISRILVQHFGEAAPMRFALEQGDIEIIASGMPSDQVEELRGKPNIEVAEAPSFLYFYCGWTQDPSKNEALANPLVTQAIKYALDYDGHKKLYPGSVRPASPVALGQAGALPEEEGFQYDPERAKQLLAEAGYPNGFDLTISTQSDTWLGYSYTRFAEKVQQDLTKVGINAKLETEPSPVFLPPFRAGEKEFSVVLFFPDYPDAANTLLFFSPAGPWGNRAKGWKDDEYVRLVNEAMLTVDTEQRLEMYRKAQRRLIDTSPHAILAQPPITVPYRDQLTGVYADALTTTRPQFIGRKT